MIICIRVINIVPFGRQVEKKQTALLSGALLFFLFFCFLRTSFLVFYFFFELLSFPIIGLILIWGRQPERLQASLYLMAYVFLGGVPFLFALLYNKALGLERSSLIYLVFLIKTPIYLLHFWLPKVHVESPTVGSVLLAALLLKVGAYAMARLLNPSRCLNVVFWGALVGGRLSALICLLQPDIKSLIAFSRVHHMTIGLAGFVVGVATSFQGVVLLAIGHGFVSAGLFWLAGEIHHRLGSRRLLLIQKFRARQPLQIIIFFLRIAALGFPPSILLLIEILIFSAFQRVGACCYFFLLVSALVGRVYIVFFFYKLRAGHSLSPFKASTRFSVRKVSISLLYTLLAYRRVFPLL